MKKQLKYGRDSEIFDKNDQNMKNQMLKDCKMIQKFPNIIKTFVKEIIKK